VLGVFLNIFVAIYLAMVLALLVALICGARIRTRSDCGSEPDRKSTDRGHPSACRRSQIGRSTP